MIAKLTRIQQAVVLAIRNASTMTGKRWVYGGIAFAVCKRFINPHVNCLSVLKAIEEFDEQILRIDNDSTACFSHREPKVSEVLATSKEPEYFPDDELARLVVQITGKPVVAMPSKVKPTLTRRNTAAFDKARSRGPKPGHNERRMQILIDMAAAGRGGHGVINLNAETICRRVEPDQDPLVILGRMVKKDWLEKTKSGNWIVTKDGLDAIRDFKSSRS